MAWYSGFSWPPRYSLVATENCVNLEAYRRDKERPRQSPAGAFREVAALTVSERHSRSYRSGQQSSGVLSLTLGASDHPGQRTPSKSPPLL
jgi:hypothetical protein